MSNSAFEKAMDADLARHHEQDRNPKWDISRMSSIDIWNEVHKNRQWGTCPEPAVARWAMRRWGGRDKDAKGGVRLLEVGCGVGAMAFWLANNGFLVDAIDSSEHAIKRAEHLYGNIYPHSLRFNVGQIEDINIHELWGTYDGVVDVCCLQHVDDIDKALGSIRAALREGSALFSIMATQSHTPITPDSELAGSTFHRLHLMEVHEKFSGKLFSSVKVETMQHTDGGRMIAHWIVEATK